MAKSKQINLGELAIAIALNTKALQDGLNEVKVQLKNHGKDVQSVGQDYDKLAIVAGLALYKVSGAIKGGLDAFNQYRSSMVGLQSVVVGTGNNFKEAQKFINDYTNDGLIPASNAATALKNLLNRGYTQTQAEEVLNRLKDSASFGRQASLSLGDAVQSAAEGLKNENSILVDNAGVTKNVSVMWKEYAETIGKSVNDLTQAQKIQAEYNGIMKETQHQVGDAAKYANEFAGAQAKNAAETLKMKQAFGAALAPALREIYDLLNGMLPAVTAFISSNKSLIAILALVAVAFLSAVTALTAFHTVTKLLSPAVKELGVALTFLEKHPAIIALTALAAVLGYVYTQVKKNKQEQDAYNKTIAEHNKLVKDGIDKSQISAEQEKVDKLKELIENYKNLSEVQSTINKLQKERENTGDTSQSENLRDTAVQAAQYKKTIESLKSELQLYNISEKEAVKMLKEKQHAIEEASRVTAYEYNDRAKDIATRKSQITETQNLIKAYKSAKTGSDDWKNAQSKLVDQFPQFATAAGIKIDAIQKTTTAQQNAVNAEWAMLQAEIQMSIIKVKDLIAVKNAALDAAEAERSIFADRHTENQIDKYTEKTKDIDKTKGAIKGLNDEIIILQQLAAASPSDIPGIKPITVNSSAYKSYENAALDNALKIMEHKKAINKLSLQDELTTLETIMKKYAKTADEKMDLEERIYAVKQAIIQKSKDAQEKALEDESKKVQQMEDAISKRTQNSENWIDRQNNLGNLSGEDEIAAYNRILAYHREYLAKVKADNKISASDKKKIIDEEAKYIQDTEDKILQIKKDYIEKAVNDYISAKKKQYDTEEELENDRLNSKLDALDKEYKDKEKALEVSDRNTELSTLTEQEKKYLNAQTDEGKAKLKEIQDRIKELNKDAAKDQMDAEKEAKEQAIQDELKANETKYNNLRNQLETEQQAMLSASMKFAQESQTQISGAANSIANDVSGIIKNFDNSTQNIVEKGLQKLQSMLKDYKSIINDMSNTKINLAGIGFVGAGGTLVPGAAGTVVNVNDWGDKIINSKDEAIDYTQELFNTAQNAVRGG
ncbi:MAG: hypothetical protein Q8882_08315 [Bacillota bacterium]|nr:hypothetical protein [Bacillota bacterium]